jgi:hypothetical protein
MLQNPATPCETATAALKCCIDSSHWCDSMVECGRMKFKLESSIAHQQMVTNGDCLHFILFGATGANEFNFPVSDSCITFMAGDYPCDTYPCNHMALSDPKEVL